MAESSERAGYYRAEKVEKLYQNLETKIDIAKRAWIYAQSLPIPTANDSLEQQLEERGGLEGFISQAREIFPEAASKIPKVHTLKEEVEFRLRQMKRQRLSVYDPDDLALTDQYLDLMSDPDLRFLITFENGIKTAIEKRGKIRSCIAELGSQWNRHESAYKLLGERSSIASRVTHITVSRFSINLFITPDAFIDIHGNGKALAFHSSNTVFNFIDDRWAYRAHPGHKVPVFNQRPTIYWESQDREMQATLEHEDFHSFYDGFDFSQSPDSPNSNVNFYTTALFYSEIDKLPPQQKLQFVKGLKRSVNEAVDMIKEECLADFAASRYQGRNLDLRGFTRGFELRAGLEKIADRLPEAASFIKLSIAKLSLPDRLAELRQWYQILSERAPGRQLDLEIAYAILPLAKTRRLENLIHRWVNQQYEKASGSI